ncbi:MAG: alpha/beta fold hydrolase [Bacteroidales bacterium]|nr:alpha/beta fold hydrolase [Bacteroidales bacterium]
MYLKIKLFIKRNYSPAFRPADGLLLLVSVILFHSCGKDEEKSFKNLISAEKAIGYSPVYIDNLVNAAAAYYPEIDQIKPLISDGADVYTIIYKTMLDGKAIEASGLMCVPQAAGKYPVICFQNGTNTVDAYAPSNFPLNTQYQMIEIIASLGYVVLIPDYPGFGASAEKPHPYLIRELTVRAVTDMIRAAKEAGGSLIKEIEADNLLAFIGYSQGGWATMALHKAVETEYGNEFELAGSVCGAGPYDIKYLFSSMINTEVYPMPVYIGYIVNAYSYYKQFTNPVTDILNEPYATTLASLYNGRLDFSQINSQLTTSVPSLINSSFLTGFDTDVHYESVRNAMVLNSIAPWHTTKPLYLIHGGNDTQVNPQVTDYFYDRLIEAGSSPLTVKKEILPGLDHGDAAVPAIVKGLIFINDLMKGAR